MVPTSGERSCTSVSELYRGPAARRRTGGGEGYCSYTVMLKGDSLTGQRSHKYQLCPHPKRLDAPCSVILHIPYLKDKEGRHLLPQELHVSNLVLWDQTGDSLGLMTHARTIGLTLQFE